MASLIGGLKIKGSLQMAGTTVHTHVNDESMYRSPSLYRTPLLPVMTLLEVSNGEREHHLHSPYMLPRICLIVGVCPL